MVVLDEGGAEKLNGKGRAIYKKLRCQQMQAYVIEDDLINTVVGPKVTIRAKKEATPNARKETATTTTAGTYTAEFEETGLSND
jgi:S-DNA-T family DNA segregation ATPase FtsK/SpoIIIE